MDLNKPVTGRTTSDRYGRVRVHLPSLDNTEKKPNIIACVLLKNNNTCVFSSLASALFDEIEHVTEQAIDLRLAPYL